MAGPEPEDSTAIALQKMFPQGSPSAQQQAADWLSKSFGVIEYQDLEGIAPMADTAMDLVNSDASVSADAKAVLQDLFKALNGGQEREPPRLGQPGTRAHDFFVLGDLGSGSFAKVHKCREGDSDKEVAIKEVNTSKMEDDAFREQLQMEITIHKKLRHKNILECYDSFEENGSVYLLLELARGDLHHLLQKDKTLKEVDAARVFAEVASGVHYMHLEDVMHRDLKPENVMLDGNNTAKIADFGECAPASVPSTKECGSPAYLAPEMAAGLEYNFKVDTWALGILLYEMLVGCWPFNQAFTIKETKNKIISMDYSYGAWSPVPAPAQPLLRLILRKDPSDRPTLLEVLSHPWIINCVGEAVSTAAQELESKLKQKCGD